MIRKTASGRYQVDVSLMRHGRKFREKKTVKSLITAREVERALQRDLYARAYGFASELPGMTISELFAAYLKHSQATKRSADKDRQRAVKILGQLSEIPVADLSTDDLVAYRTVRTSDGVRPATINREMSLLSAAIRYGLETRRVVMPFNPCRLLKPLPENRPIRPDLTDDDLSQICTGRSDHVRRFFLLARFTGLRHAALLALEWSQVRNGMIYPPHGQEGHSKAHGRVPVRPGIEPLLQHEPGSAGRVFTFNGDSIASMNPAMNRARKSAKINFVIHDFRAAFNNELLRYGVPDYYRRVMMGHSTAATGIQARYIHVTDEDLKREMGKLPSVAPLIEKILAAPGQTGYKNLTGWAGKTRKIPEHSRPKPPRHEKKKP